MEISKETFQTSFQQALADSAFADGYLMAQCTNRFILEKVRGLNAEELVLELLAHGLDIRVFSEQSEIKWLRSSIADDTFLSRMTEPEAQKPSEDVCWDEEQYLDIDTTRSDSAKQQAVTTGGGKYHLPLSNYLDAKLRVRNYLSYEEDTGMAYVSDWRLAGFIEGRK